AVISSLIEVGAPEIRLANRTRNRSEALRDEFGAKLQIFDWVQAGNMLDGAMTVVNTTSLGMIGKPEFKVPLDALEASAVVTDLVYTPLQTALLAKAQEIGCQTVDGLGMLLYQAVPGFERWFGHRPDVDDETRRVILNQ
ncbi:MAG: shikimate dehydrogenase, partial [Celeribacter marinus]